MSSPAQSDLRSHVASFSPDPALDARLLRIYHRKLAERLWTTLTEAGSNERIYFEQTPTIWLHPRAVWAAHELQRDAGVLAGMRDEVHQDLLRSTTAIPDIEYIVNGNGDQWSKIACGYITDYDHQLGGDGELSLSAGDPGEFASNVNEALRILAEIWPEAEKEFRGHIRTFVVVAGGIFLFGSFQNMLGSIYATEESLGDPTEIVETLLHEGGHQSLFVHSAFASFVDNPLTMVSHPLRQDPRPLGGTVHAAYVLGRMAVGYTRWTEHPDVPARVHERRESTVQMLKSTIGTLEANARWTATGERLFDELTKACAGLE